jgi:hypothetical protein
MRLVLAAAGDRVIVTEVLPNGNDWRNDDDKVFRIPNFVAGSFAPVKFATVPVIKYARIAKQLTANTDACLFVFLCRAVRLFRQTCPATFWASFACLLKKIDSLSVMRAPSIETKQQVFVYRSLLGIGYADGFIRLWVNGQVSRVILGWQERSSQFRLL